MVNHNVPPEDDAVILAPADDARLARAIARAHHRLPEFVSLLREHPLGVRFLVKAAFRRTDGPGHKHMWVRVSALEGESFVGTLANDPQGKTLQNEGELVRIPIAEIEDWMHDRGGKKYVGGFSLPVLDEIDRARRDQRGK